MRVLLILIVICFISCKNKTDKKNCIINLEIPKNTASSKGAITILELNKNILKVSISNLKNDTLHFAVPHLIFAKEAIQDNIEESDAVVKQFIPNIITDSVIAYYITENKKNYKCRFFKNQRC